MKTYFYNVSILFFSVVLVLGSNVKATQCGNNNCGVFEYCCNESCGICSSIFGGTCSQQNCCPQPLPDIACFYDYNPVKCPDECVYSNACQATAAGQAGCCPTPDEGIFCPAEYAPTTCADGCEYDNDCLAMAAGQDMKKCGVVGPKCGTNTCEVGEVCCNENCGICSPPGGFCSQEYCCPKPREDIICYGKYAPVVCADGCEYDNDCLAQAAGQTSCNPSSSSCPEPVYYIDCGDGYNPVTCSGGCEYDNACLARAAGQDMRTCNRGPCVDDLNWRAPRDWTRDCNWVAQNPSRRCNRRGAEDACCACKQ